MTAARPMDKLNVAAGLICGESGMWHWLQVLSCGRPHGRRAVTGGCTNYILFAVVLYGCVPVGRSQQRLAKCCFALYDCLLVSANFMHLIYLQMSSASWFVTGLLLAILMSYPYSQ